ncbi:serine/threonine-protein phosphatase 2A 55 kDa regulatory subunit B delta isoform isoform X3 [Pteropus medius]|uniref:serine/threonine-protein phosphatase 2A 55 kDa regulatory subunit B delta isoform isoform X3 n=1 Tax=Pteropus vampyrus TaxID=132908 RepID=UPI00196ADC96|nr:serine/threonine-protein phosphatase 2A 55 kDa regulatory subunit B delta isoform isoform X3 [Pteropus giganteus]
MVGTIPGGHCVENKAWEDLCTPTCQDRGPGSSAERPATISVPSTGAEQGGLRHRAARGSAGPPGWHPHSVSHAALRISPVAGVTFVSYIISTVELNHFGDLLATGDKGGGVVIFQWNKRVLSPSACLLAKYKCHTGLQAHSGYCRRLGQETAFKRSRC